MALIKKKRKVEDEYFSKSILGCGDPCVFSVHFARTHNPKWNY